MSTFQFKQFSVQNVKSAMKVNTDSVVLGGWARVPLEAKNGLDIGTGTGVLALMIAQRKAEIEIIGIEIEPNAFEEANLNFGNSPWKERLTSVNLPLQEYHSESKFDFIITNPPYFIGDLKNQDSNKTQARHTDSLSFEEIVEFVVNHLSPIGNFNLILPKKESEIFIDIATKTNLYLNKIAFIKPNIKKEVNRVLMCFSFSKENLEEETFCVYQSQGVYSKRHLELTQDFYLER